MRIRSIVLEVFMSINWTQILTSEDQRWSVKTQTSAVGNKGALHTRPAMWVTDSFVEAKHWADLWSVKGRLELFVSGPSSRLSGSPSFTSPPRDLHWPFCPEPIENQFYPGPPISWTPWGDTVHIWRAPTYIHDLHLVCKLTGKNTSHPQNTWNIVRWTFKRRTSSVNHASTEEDSVQYTQ